MSVIKIVIVDNGKSMRFFVFLYRVVWAPMVLRIPNLEGHQNCIIGLKITTILTMFLVHNNLGGVSRGRSVAVGVCDRLKVAYDI